MNAIEFENISKQYKLGYVSTKTLSHDLNRWWTVHVRHKEDPYLKIGSINDRSKKADSDYVWALKDINFNVEQGDVVGIIGKNGAGKSTLLKLLSRVTAPTTGEIRARGRIASLLEVGTGFHTELTGRENIFMNGSIMGMTKKEIKSKLDEIVDFAGVERYIDTPVKRYSSGMMVRLGFAVAAHLDPEILVVDEVLAVGDAEFQKKAIGKMQDVSKGEGRTVLFVSHNMASIKALCNHGVVLKNGNVDYIGGISDAIDRYIGNYCISMNNVFFDDINNAPGNNNIRIKSFEVTPVCGTRLSVESGIRFRLVFYNYTENAMIDATFKLQTIEGVIVFVVGKVLSPDKDSKEGFYEVEFSLPPYLLNTGKYLIGVWFGENQRYVLWGTYEHSFELENNLKDQGYNLDTHPGVLKLNLEYQTNFYKN